MPYIRWDSSYLTHIEEIDEQHKRLVDLINQLHENMMSGQGSTALRPVLSSLLKYVFLHFSKEEQLMKECGYPLYLEHKSRHDAYAKEIKGFLKQYRDNTPLLARKVLLFLGEWAREHIHNVDKEYIPYISGNV